MAALLFFLLIATIKSEQRSISEKARHLESADTYIDKVFQHSLPSNIDEIYINESSDIKQISGCQFTDLDITTKDFFIRLVANISIFSNSFEYTSYTTDRPGCFLNEITNGNKLFIDKCTFNLISGKSYANILYSGPSTITNTLISNSLFFDCGEKSNNRPNFCISHQESSIEILNCTFHHEDPQTSRILSMEGSQASITFCKFDNCGENAIDIGTGEMTTSNNGLFNFSVNEIHKTNTRFINAQRISTKPIFNHNYFHLCEINDQYLVYISHNVDEIQILNNSFSTITRRGTGEYNCGGASVFFERNDANFKLKYTHCIFTNVSNLCTSHPSSQGGAIQYYSNNNVNVDIELDSCYFFYSSAYLHGGAVSLQTSGSVLIKSCQFRGNSANVQDSSSKLLFNNYNDLKSSGFGGAIFLNPSFNKNGQNYQMTQVQIVSCTFNENRGYKGYVIYIEGDQCDTTFNITGNNFNKNTGLQGELNNGIIATEIFSIIKETIEQENSFNSLEGEVISENISYVDHTGERIPDPTETPFPTSSPIPSSLYINKVYIGSLYNGTEQIQAGEDNIQQISGCQFIDINNTFKVFYIKIVKHISVFNNIFENTQYTTQKSGIFWYSVNNGPNFNIVNCTFIKISGKESDASVLNSDSITVAHITFNECFFIDCGEKGNDRPIVNILQQDSTIEFISCNFEYKEPSISRVLELKGNGATFESCQFVNTGTKSIDIGIADISPIEPGIFTFISNNVRSVNTRFINAPRMKSQPIIRNNVFYDSLIINDHFIYIIHDQDMISISDNNFSSFVCHSTEQFNSGGAAIFIERNVGHFELIFDNCLFYNISNTNSMYPSNQGGVLQYFSSSNVDVDIQINGCNFINTMANFHGGAISIRTAGKVVIQQCIFSSNFAHFNSGSRLLFDNYYNNKTNGFGGAIYLNPSFRINDNDYQMTQVSIIQCSFMNCIGYQGSAIYIEGEDCDTIFDIRENSFNIDDTRLEGQTIGAFLATEINRINKDEFEQYNEIDSIIDSIDSFVYVDHSGVKIPDSTETPSMTPFPSATTDPNLCGPNARFSLESNFLTITGSGPMYDYINVDASPWYNDRESIQNATIQEGITHIGSYAFYGFSLIEILIIPETITSIGKYAFGNCFKLNNINLPSNLESIDAYAFDQCTNFKDTFTFPEKVTIIEAKILNYCFNINSIVFLGNVTTIKDYAFAHCQLLMYINVPENITYLGKYVFYDCTRLGSIHIPKTIEFIDQGCFNKASMLVAVYFLGTKNPTFGNNVFEGTKIDFVYVKSDYIDDNFCNFPIAQYPGLTTSHTLQSDELTITGTGIMLDYSPNFKAPWYDNISKIRSVIIQEGITTIGTFSFYSLPNFDTIQIAESVISIRSFAFFNNSKLSSIQLPQNLSSTGHYTFANTALQSILIPRSLLSIVNDSFRDCTMLSTVVLEDTLTTIENNAFYGCRILDSISLPSSLTFIGKSTFENCYKLTSIIIPEKVTVISNHLLRNCIGLQSVKLLGNITSIGELAFNFCSELSNISLPSSVIEIQMDAFMWCGSLTTFEFPEKVTIIEYGVLAFCGKMTSVTFLGNITQIGETSFYNCYLLKDITIPESCTSINKSAFFSCTSLATITIPKNIASIGEKSFANCTSLVEIFYLGTTDPTYNELIFEFAGTQVVHVLPEYKHNTFCGYEVVPFPTMQFTMSQVFLPTNGFTSSSSFSASSIFTSSSEFIVSSIFSSSSQFTLSDIFTSSLTFISSTGSSSFTPSSSFSSSSSFTPSSVFTDSSIFTSSFYFTNSNEFTPSQTFLYVYDFSGSCGSDLKYTSISNELTITGTGEMDNYSEETRVPWHEHVESITSVTIAEGVTSIGSNAFSSCSKLLSVLIPSSVQSIGTSAFYNCTNIRSIQIPENVTIIETNCFYGCISLFSVIVLGPITEIGSNAFYGCERLENIMFPKNSYSKILPKDSELIAFPSSLGKIGSGCFSGCITIASVEIPFKVNTIEEEVFNGCSSLTSVSLHLNIQSIKEKAFNCCYKLDSIELPQGLESLGGYAFCNCSSLKSITIPVDITTIERCLFYLCTNLQSIRILGDIKSIKTFAFNHCDKLTEISLPHDVSDIEFSAFENCIQLASIEIPAKVTTIDTYTFHNCFSLSSITFLGSITTINMRAFANCNSLKSITLPESVTYLGSNAFYYCTNLKSIVIPKNVNFIGDSCFYSCSALSSVTYEGLDNPKYGSSVFLGTKVEKVNVPPKYKGVDFCSNSISRISTDIFSPSQTFYESLYFTSSSEFTVSRVFTASSLLGPTMSPSASIAGISESVSYVISYVSRKSVTLSISFYASQSYSFILLSNGEYSLASTDVFAYKYLPYIIYYLSQTYISTGVFIELNIKKKTITQEQLIGVVCGSAAVFFLVLAAIILIVQRKNKAYAVSEESLWDSESNEMSDEHTQDIDIDITPPEDNFV